MKLEYIDRVYGKVSITQPVVLDFLESPSMQRLKGINSGGHTEPFIGMKYHSRFEHSVGDYALLQRYGAQIKQQLAGLLHDVSHPAFSHSIDYLVGGNGAEQSHQDDNHVAFVKQSEIPDILLKYGFDVDEILDDSSFPLQEQPAPDLCADRIDYSLRGALDYKVLTEKEVRKTLESLLTKKGKWIFKDVKSARMFAELYKEMNTKYWTSFADAKKMQQRERQCSTRWMRNILIGMICTQQTRRCWRK